MSGKTANFGLGYFDFKDPLDSALSVQVETHRFLTIDSQLFGLYSIFGKGVVSGLEVIVSTDIQLPFSLMVNPGVFFLLGRSVELPAVHLIEDIPSNSQFYVFANFTRSLNTLLVPSISISLYPIMENSVRLAAVVTGNGTISNIDLSFKNEISFRQLIINEIAKHKHRGDPDRIDLSREVKNSLPGARISDLDTAKIKRGVFKKERIPKLNHNDLKNKGFIGHAGLESFVRTIPDINRQLLGEVASVNLMRQNLFNIKKTPELASEIVNTVAIVPGITNNGLIDFDNSTAIINIDSGCITGEPEQAGMISTIKYESLGALQSYVNKANITFSTPIPIPPSGSGDIIPPPFGDASTDGYARISSVVTSSNFADGGNDNTVAFRDSFENPNNDNTAFPGLFISTESIPSSTTYSATPDQTFRTNGIYSVKFRGGKKEKLLFKRSVVINKNWSEYARINIDVRCKSASHSQVYFYFYNKNQAGQLEQSDVYTLLVADELTSNSDSSQQDFVTKTFEIIADARNQVDTIVFEVADVEADFVFNVDNVVVSGFIVTDGGGQSLVTQSYFPSGILLYRYVSSNLINLNSLFYDVVIPDGTSIEFRYRIGSNIISIMQESFSEPILSDQYIGSVGRVIDIQINFKAKVETDSNNNPYYSDTPILNGFILQISSSGEYAGFNISTVDQWLNGKGENIKILPSIEPLGELTIRTPLEIKNYYYATQNTVQKAYPNFVSYFGYSGNLLPLSPNQSIEIAASDGRRGLDTPVSVSRLSNKNLLICDTYNDRVLEVDNSGNLIRGFGSHYSLSTDGFFPISVIFNPRTGILQLLFNTEFDVDPNTFIMSSIRLYSGTVSSSLSILDSIVELGITKRILNIKLSTSKVDFIQASDIQVFVKLTPTGFDQPNGFTASETFRRLYSLDGLELFTGNFSYIDGIRHPVCASKSYNGNWWIANSNVLFDRLRAGLRNDNDEFFVQIDKELKFTLIVDIDDSIRAQDHRITFVNDPASVPTVAVGVVGNIQYAESVTLATKTKYTAEVKTTPNNPLYVINPEGSTFIFSFRVKVEVKNEQTGLYEEILQSPFYIDKRMTVLASVQQNDQLAVSVPSLVKLDTSSNTFNFTFGDVDSFTFSDYTLGSVQELDKNMILIGGLQKFSQEQQPPVEPQDPDSFEGQAVSLLAPYRGRMGIYDTELNSFVFNYESSDNTYISDTSRISNGEFIGSYLVAESTITANGGRIIVIDRFNNIVREINTGEYTIINDARVLANGNFLLSV